MKSTDWLAMHFSFTEEQCARHDTLMSMNMSDWPGALYYFCFLRSQQYGVSGDMLADTVAEWIADGEPAHAGPPLGGI